MDFLAGNGAGSGCLHYFRSRFPYVEITISTPRKSNANVTRRNTQSRSRRAVVGAAGPALKDLPSPWSCGSRDSPKGDSSSRSELACAPLDDEPVSCHSHGAAAMSRESTLNWRFGPYCFSTFAFWPVAFSDVAFWPVAISDSHSGPWPFPIRVLARGLARGHFRFTFWPVAIMRQVSY